MSDTFLFRSNKTGFMLQVFGVSLKDSREFAVNTNGNLDMKYVGKNMQCSKYTCGAVTEKQHQKNKENLERIMGNV